MRNFLVKILCMLVPSKKARRNIRATMMVPKEQASTVLKENGFSYIQYLARLHAANRLHPNTFAQYKNKFCGKKVVICAAGPTLKSYKPIKDAIHIGLNRSFLFDAVKFDFLFCIDKIGITDFVEGFSQYDCKKFIGYQSVASNQDPNGRVVSQSEFYKMKNASRYVTDGEIYLPIDIPVDIDIFPLKNFSSVALQAMQFALYTNPSEIYLVGCDCTVFSQGHFVKGKHDSESKKHAMSVNSAIGGTLLVDDWKYIKKFAELYYPDTKIISVNPVGLRGVFNDFDQGGEK